MAGSCRSIMYLVFLSGLSGNTTPNSFGSRFINTTSWIQFERGGRGREIRLHEFKEKGDGSLHLFESHSEPKIFAGQPEWGQHRNQASASDRRCTLQCKSQGSTPKNHTHKRHKKTEEKKKKLYECSKPKGKKKPKTNKLTIKSFLF